MKTIRESDPFKSIYTEPGQKIQTEWHNDRKFTTVATAKPFGCGKCAFNDRLLGSNRNVCERVQCTTFQRSKTSNGFPLDPNFKETSVFFREDKSIGKKIKDFFSSVSKEEAEEISSVFPVKRKPTL